MVNLNYAAVAFVFAFILLAGCASKPEGLYGPQAPATTPPASQPSIPAKTTEQQAQDFCGQANVAMVYVCGNYFAVVSSLLGGGTTFYEENRQIQCPVVGPDSMSAECKQLELGSNCAQIDICNTPAPPMPGSDRDEHGCIGSAGYTWCESSQKCIRSWEENCTEQMVGNDTDEHGCIGSAGYTWCNVTQTCIRPWEQNCTAQAMPGSDRDAHGCIGSAGYTWCESSQKCIRSWEENCTVEVMPGADRDVHGCIPSAGYTWCDSKQKCLRIWEEGC